MRRAGFTLIEVMMALAVLTVAAGALIGTQMLTARSNTQARQITIATEIAQTWAERLKLDAVSWTDINGLASTTWLIDSTLGMNNWINPQTVVANVLPAPTRSFAFDRYGRDIQLGGTDLFYCVAYRFNWVVDPNLAPGSNPAMRVDIRVFWPREDTATVPACDVGPGLNPVLFRSVGLPIVVKRTVLGT